MRCKQLIIVHTDQEEAVGRGRRARVAACGTPQQRRHRAGLAKSAADLHKRADNGPDHMTKKAVAGDLVRHPAVTIVEGPNGLVFFKLTGPSATIEHAAADFDRMIGSLRGR